jgi:WD40 repeat protein
MGNANLEVAFFEIVSPMTSPRFLHTATLFQYPSKNGFGILLAGGGTQFSGGTILASSDIYDYFTRTITAGPVMNVARQRHSATLLPGGQVLIAGGLSASGIVASSELFDPSSNAFGFSGSMTTPRAGHTATLLNTGQVLITGGSTSSAELYDPSTGTFTATGSMAVSRSGHTATLLPDGRVLVAGGQGTTLAELYDPATGAFTAAGNLTTERKYLAAALLTNGTVLLTGGFLTGNPMPLASAEIYDPVARTFTATANTMSTPRAFHTATTLQNGQVLVAGGGAAPESATTIDRFDPLSGKFVGAGSMATGHTNGARNGHTATLIPDGSSLVLLSGGNVDNLGNPTGIVEFYQPGVPQSPGLLAPPQ